MAAKRIDDRDQLTDLQQLMNVGPSIAGCLQRIEIDCPGDLRGQDPFEMYERLCQVEDQRYDPCVIDVFISVVDYMNGNSARPWWKYTPERKKEMARRAAMAPSERNTANSGRLGRRAFLSNGVLVLLAAKTLQANPTVAHPTGSVSVRFGAMTDLHYADKKTRGTRYYQQTPAKLEEARKKLSALKPDFVVELGDFIDAAESLETEKGYLQTAQALFAKLPGKHHYVLGNHCVYWLTKKEFLETVGQPKSYYSFDVHGTHFIILDACFRGDGEPYGRKNYQWTDANIPAEELKWLKEDLEKTKSQSIVFVHQRLDVGGHYGIKNAPAVRSILEKSGNVLAVFQGHNHINDYREIAGIHYCTLNAMVEGPRPDNNAFAAIEVLENKTIRVTGFRKQKSYQM